MSKRSSTSQRLTRYLLRKMVGSAIMTLALAIVVASVIIALPHSSFAQATSRATLQVTPTSGHYTNRDDQQPIGVHGTNYAANEKVKVYWNYTGPGTGILEATTTTTNKGSFTTSFQYQLAAYGTYTIAGVGQTSLIVQCYIYTPSSTLYTSTSRRPRINFHLLWQCLCCRREREYLLEL